MPHPAPRRDGAGQVRFVASGGTSTNAIDTDGSDRVRNIRVFGPGQENNGTFL